MSINVSTFELLVKPIAPPALIPADFRGVARRIVQGYFLTITNLFSQNIRFRFEFNGSLPTDSSPNRSFVGSPPSNVDLIYDIAGQNLPLTRLSTGGSFLITSVSGEFTLPSRQTATVQLLPRLTESLLRNPNSDFEIRGYVTLEIPRNPPLLVNGSFRPGSPQANQMVPVLLQPEIRGTFLPNDLSTANIDFDQINYSLIPASGQAFNEINPVGFSRLSVNPELLTSVMENLASESFINENFSDDQAVQLSNLVANISQLEPSSENLAQLSNLLAQMNIPIVMEPRPD